jgi:hypothetical protein
MGNSWPLGLADREIRGQGILLSSTPLYECYEQQILLSLFGLLSLRHTKWRKASREVEVGKESLRSLSSLAYWAEVEDVDAEAIGDPCATVERMEERNVVQLWWKGDICAVRFGCNVRVEM